MRPFYGLCVSFLLGLGLVSCKQEAAPAVTTTTGVGHGKWDVTYADPALYAWFLEHSK